MTRILVLAAACAGLLGMSGGVFAVELFSDDFETDNTSTQLNFSGLIQWDVSGGAIDYIRVPNGFGISCAGGAGGCVDTDGSISNSGRMTTKSAFGFAAGQDYTLSVDLSGNQRGGLDDSIGFGITDGVTDLFSQMLTLDPFEPFATLSLLFTPGSSFAGRIFVEGSSNDNVGPILDNVLLDARQTQQVDEPPVTSLLVLLLASLAAARRRPARRNRSR